MAAPNLLILGASARAAAFSALRAGLHPWCVDLFADRDLQQRCSVMRLRERYPEGFRRFIESALHGPWMYAGGLENHPRLVERWARQCSLWGNNAMALFRARDPSLVTRFLQSRKMPAPALVLAGEQPPRRGRWLLKPRRSAAGAGIRFWSPEQHMPPSGDWYLQEHIEGEPLGLLFLGVGSSALFLGMTRQLVGEPWLHAEPFHYCGSIGPLDVRAVQRPSLEELGHLLASECFLRGLFGVDGILREETFWPVEINPRYTASVEVLEYATGRPLLGYHAHVFTHRAIPPLPPPSISAGRTIGKAILFAHDDLRFPVDGPWMAELRSPKPVHELPDFADIPAAGERIERGKPILTLFATADSVAACENALRRIAADLDRWLFER